MLHLLVGRDCNNNCLFCMEADRRGRSEHAANQSSQDVRRMIQEYPETDEILFTNGEPTLCQDLPQYVTWAKERGFKTIGLISNGRRLTYPLYLEDLVTRGLNRVTLSVHGHTSSLHDGLTRTPGSFRQTRAGLIHCARMAQTHGLQLHTSTVLTRRNLPHLQAIAAMLRSFHVHETVYNVMMAKGRGAQHFKRLMPRYGDVLIAFHQLADNSEKRSNQRIRVVDMPPCVLRCLPLGMGGDSEEYDQYEPTGSTGVAGFEVFNPASTQHRRVAPKISGRAGMISERYVNGDPDSRVEGLERSSAKDLSPPGSAKEQARVVLQAFSGNGEEVAMDTLRRTVSEPVLGEQNAYYLTHRSFKDQFLRVKGPPCETCSIRESCPGVWEPYAEHFGWDDMEPIPMAVSAQKGS